MQLLNQENNDEEGLLLMIKAFENLLRLEKADSHDTEFEALETLVTFVATRKVAYSAAVAEAVRQTMFKLKVAKPEHQ